MTALPTLRRARVLLPCAIALWSLSCSQSGDPDPGGNPDPASLSFSLDTVTFTFSGDAAWPPAGSGVLLRADSAASTLQVAAFRQTFGRKPDQRAAVPESRFDLLYFEIHGTPAITPGPYTSAAAAAGFDVPLSGLDSLGYTGTVSVNLTAFGDGRAAGTFSGSFTRIPDSAGIVISGGAFEGPVGSPPVSFGDTGSTGGSIAVAADTGTTPEYAWEGGPVYAVSVARAATPTALVWGILTSGADSIATGVRHGSTPAGASLLANTEPALTPGVPYRVTVSRLNGAYGYRVFTP